ISTLAAGGKPSRNTITVIYADGQIVAGDMEADDYVFGTTLAGKLRTARLDEHTKAVVLRVNSPGGSALASDVVWREMELLRESKPVVVSMGAYAASGGYYISAPADVILADRLTVTGSIGVYGIMFNIGNALSSKLGITFDGVATSPAANMSMLHELNATQRAAITKGVDKVYDTFTRLVADGRNLPLDKVLEIAGGRVYSGSDAVEIGLADANGGLSEAIAVAADKAGIADDFTIYEFRTPPSELEMLIDLFTSQMASSGSLGRLSQSQFAALRQLIEEYPFIATDNGIQTLLPQRLDFMQR
ncbi:MAG: S49 family peptidase, partial [Alistipes sp.]|nr:S49 family peptidase [Alistipes sp.]